VSHLVTGCRTGRVVDDEDDEPHERKVAGCPARISVRATVDVMSTVDVVRSIRMNELYR
jgi:hypothetical protein